MRDVLKQTSLFKVATAALISCALFVLSLSTVAGSLLIFLSSLPLILLLNVDGNRSFWQGFALVSSSLFLLIPFSATVTLVFLFLTPTALLAWCGSGDLQKNMGKTLSVLVGYFSVLMVCALVALNMSDINFSATLQESLTPLTQGLEVSGAEDKLQKILPFFPSVFCFLHLGSLALNVGIARVLAVKLEKKSLVHLSLRTAVFHKHWDMIFVLGLLLQLTGSDFFVLMGKNIACISCIPLFFVGLQVVRFWLKDISKWWFLAFFTFCFMFVWAGLAVVMLGFFNATVNLQKKLI